MAKIERQLPDALDLMTRALRAGHAFSSALKMAGEEMAEPIAGEFRTVHDEVNFGVSLEQALTHLSERVPLTDLRYFVVAVLIQRDSGGNLTEILGNLSRLIRERLKLLAKVKVLSSEGRMSAWILGLMPFFLAGVMNLANPKFMSPLWTDPIGISIIKYMLTLMLIGVVIMRRIINDPRLGELDMLILSALIFLAVTLGLAGLFLWLAPTRAEQRLRVIAGPPEKSDWTETVVKVAGPLARLSTPEGDWENSPLRMRFLYAGIRSPNARLLYFGAKTLLPLVLAGLAFVAHAGHEPVQRAHADLLRVAGGTDRLLPAEPRARLDDPDRASARSSRTFPMRPT